MRVVTAANIMIMPLSLRSPNAKASASTKATIAAAVTALAFASCLCTATATFRGAMPCTNGQTVTGDTSQYSNEHFNAARDAYFNIRLGIGMFRFNSNTAGTNYDTWLRVFPGTYQDNSGSDDCANQNRDNGVNCASCDDCGGALQTVLTMRVTNPGWYTFLVEGWASSSGRFQVQLQVLSGSCNAGFDTPGPTAAPTTPTPTWNPSTNPSTAAPTAEPTPLPTALPTVSPTKFPTTSVPTFSPTKVPTTSAPTAAPTRFPSRHPTVSPTRHPTSMPTSDPCLVNVCSADCTGPWPGSGGNVESPQCGWSFRGEQACRTIDGHSVFVTSQATMDQHLEVIPNACAHHVQLNTPDPSVFSVNTDDRAAGSPQDQLVTWCSYADDCSAEPYAPLCQTGPGTTCTARSDADLSGYGGGGGGGGGSSDASKGDDDDDGLDGTLIAIVVVGILLFLAVLIAVVMMVVGKNNDDPGGWSGASTGTRGREDGAQQIVAFDNPNYSSDIDMSSRVPMELPYQAPQPWSDESDQGLYAPVDNDDVTEERTGYLEVGGLEESV